MGGEIRQGDWPFAIASLLLQPVVQFGEEATRAHVHELVQGVRADLTWYRRWRWAAGLWG